MGKSNRKKNDLNKSRFRDAELKREVLKKYEYFNEAKKAADIVRIGIENKNYEDMNQQLKTLNDRAVLQNKYVFKYPSIIDSIVSIFFSVFFSVSFLVLLFYSIGIIIYSREQYAYGIVGTIVIVAMLLLNIYIICKAVVRIKYRKRYKKYMNVLKYSSIILINDLEAFSKEDTKTIIRDLLYAIDQKLIPQGHFSDKKNIFYVNK